jgi:Ca2+-binding RTX toxin-like protein
MYPTTKNREAAGWPAVHALADPAPDGRAGADMMRGGAGNDVFKFLAGFGQDTITDFTAHAGVAGNKDLMDISGLGITAGTFAASVKITNGGGGAATSSGRWNARRRPAPRAIPSSTEPWTAT